MSGTPLTNSSYTNKDFQSVYAELLDVAKKLSSKWDPSLSNESDPGVVLLKLNAIIADKVNYNIDKNTLEFYPETATQEMNVRNIYKQLGYNMPGYMSGSGTIVAQWLGEKRPGNIVLPLFTKITNNDNTIVYCTDAESIIPMTGEQTEISVRAGTPIIVTISGRTKLSISDLDERNRLYLSDITAAENGVFIRTYRNNTLQNDYNTWRKVNNLLLEPSNTTCFEFGIDSFYGIPYIEFPSDIDTLSPEGFTVTYLRSAGRADNISAQSLKKFFDGNAVVFDEGNNQYDLNTDNFSIDNYYDIQNNYDAETIDEARVNYKKVLGTFDTLVTLRDYINEIYFSGLTSNAVVTDRTTDKQNSISVVTNDGVQQKINSTSADMSAFDLKLYALQYVGTPTDFESYNTGFTLISSVEPNAALISYLDRKKSIQHNFYSLAKNKICILKNKYHIRCKIIPTQILNPEHKLELVSNVQQQLFEKLNSHAVSFGEKVDFQTLYDVIINSSVFIKSLSLDNISYYTYAAYFDDQEKYCEVCVSDEHPYIEGYKFGDIFYTSEEMKTSIVGDTTKYYLDTATQNIYQYRLGAYILVTDKRSTFRSDIKQNCILSGCTNLFTLQPDFDYNVFQQFLSSQEVDTITTSSVVELTTGESYTVHDNEVIRFYAPALVDVTSYSTFVKYVFHSDENAELPPNVNYTLGEGEWIAFFWKNTDSDLRFSYYKYGVGTIIHSVIGLSQDETAQSYVSNLPVGNEGRVVQTSVNTFLQQYQTGVLSSQSVVTIKKESSAVLDNYTNDCYFITNKIETHNNINQYVLFSEPEVVSSFTSWGNAISDIDNRTLFDRTNGQNGLIVFRYEGSTEKWYYKNRNGDEILLENGLADVGITLELPVINSASIQVASATGSATITNEADLLTMLTNESVTDVYTYTTAWPAGFNPELMGISVGGMWTTGDKITLSFNTGVPIAIATSASGTVTITDAEILKTHLLILNRRRTFTYGGTTWDIDPETNGITLSGTWSTGDTLIAEIDDETISVNFNSKLTESYMLKSNEYFMFKDKAVLKLYGSGTKITRNTVIQQGVYLYPEKWMCRTISPEKILEGGLSAITSSHWFTFYNNRNTLQINEMEFRNVLPGGSIQLEAFQNTDETINATRESHVVIDNSGSVVLSATVRGYNTVAAPYDVDITALYNSHILSEKGTYTLTPWITEDMGAVELGSDNTGLTNSILFTYDGTEWDVDPLTCGLTLSGAWLEGDTITATYTTVISVVVSSTDGEAIVSDENLLKSLKLELIHLRIMQIINGCMVRKQRRLVTH